MHIFELSWIDNLQIDVNAYVWNLNVPQYIWNWFKFYFNEFELPRKLAIIKVSVWYMKNTKYK